MSFTISVLTLVGLCCLVIYTVSEHLLLTCQQDSYSQTLCNHQHVHSHSLCDVHLPGHLLEYVPSMQGYGMSAWPMDLLVGRRSVTSELGETRRRREEYEADVECIRSRVSDSTSHQRLILFLVNTQGFLFSFLQV